MMIKNYEIIIEPKKKLAHRWKELWSFREVFLFLSWKDILVRYKQTVIGIVWSIIRPILTMVVFTVIFGKFAKMPSEGIPYPLLVFAAALPWELFSTSLTEVSNSLVGNAQLIGKIYIPRIILPFSKLIVSLIDFSISFVILIGLMVWYGHYPDWKIVLLPLFLLLAIVTSMGIGLWLAALNVKYRDVKYAVPFMVRLGLYISPVGFSSAVVPDSWRLIYSMNPMVGVIDGFRWVLLGNSVSFYWPGFIVSVCLAILFFQTGYLYFSRTERYFADVI